jgi:uridine phosphorylase
MKRSWYMQLAREDVGGAAILVGDPGRIDLFAAEMTGVRPVAGQRGLRTVTGTFEGSVLTVAAFGMGAPIAAIVLEELVQQGATRALRAGTALTISPELPLGSFVVAHGAVRAEGTSASYAPHGYPAVADHGLIVRVTEALEARDLPYRVGLMASLDGFFTEMVAVREDREAGVSARLDELRALGVLAVDMETSALLVVGARLGVAVGSLCLVSVAADHRSLDVADRGSCEQDLARAALGAVVSGHPVHP